MALLLSDKSYLKIDSAGNFSIYKNKTARAKEKKLDSQPIIEKYKQLINENEVSSELLYYKEDAAEEYLKILAESNKYLHALQYGLTDEEFPIMSKFFPNINDSLPKIIFSGQIGLPRKNMTTEEVYEFIKECELFGNRNEVKDI